MEKNFFQRHILHHECMRRRTTGADILYYTYRLEPILGDRNPALITPAIFMH